MKFLKELFIWEGRINRMKFWLYFITNILIFNLAIYFISSPLYNYLFVIGISDIEYLNNQWIILGPAIIIFTYVNFNIFIKRLNDLNKVGYFSLLYPIPFINILLVIYLGFFKGTPEKNKYGPDPLEGNKNVINSNPTPDEL